MQQPARPLSRKTVVAGRRPAQGRGRGITNRPSWTVGDESWNIMAGLSIRAETAPGPSWNCLNCTQPLGFGGGLLIVV